MLNRARLHYERLRTIRAYKYGNWRTLPIRENGEPLVQVPAEYCYPYYVREMRLITDDRVFLRREVLNRYLRAQRTLRAHGFDLVVYDGWRSVELQENLFWFYLREFTAARFNRREEFAALREMSEIRDHFNGLPPDVQTTLREANRMYVSWPSRDPASPSPHATGGSIDVWLYKDGVAANLGVPFDWMEADAGAFYHMKRWRKSFPGDRRVSFNRDLLLLAMIDAGFSCYPPEIWHFNFGNQMDALVKGGPAVYSYIEPIA